MLEAGAADRPLMQSALRLFDDCLRQHPADTTVRFNRALALKSLGRIEEAAADLQLCLGQEHDKAWVAEIGRVLASLRQNPR
jgi:hypothetical protein